MTTYTVRPPAEGDIPAITRLFNTISQAAYGVDDTTEDETRLWFTAPTVDPELDIRVVVDAGGGLVGYGDVYREGGKAWLDIREHPRVGDGGAARAVLEALVPRARQLVPEPVVLRGSAPERELALKAMYDAAGFAVIRHSFRMGIELDGAPPEPEWPDGIAVRTFERGRDERTVFDVQNEGFADMWEYVPEPYDEWLHFMTTSEDFDPTLWFLAEDGAEVAAVCLCRPHEPGDPELGWVRVLCVRPRWRRRGIALALLRHAFREFHRRGRPRAGLGVDAESTTGALELYERAGMRVLRRADIYEKILE